MMKTVYLDTTIPSYLHDDRESLRTHIQVTQRWWREERPRYDLWVSEETLDELGAGDYPHKLDALKLVGEIPILAPADEVTDIARVYVDNQVMARSLTGDALHLAYASFYAIDFLLTWNCNHLANANKRQHIRIVNARLGLATPEIVTPLELVTEEPSS